MKGGGWYKYIMKYLNVFNKHIFLFLARLAPQIIFPFIFLQDLHNHLTSLYFLHSDILTTFLHAYLEIGAILLDEADAEGFGLYHNATTIDFEIREILDRFELLILQVRDFFAL